VRPSGSLPIWRPDHRRVSHTGAVLWYGTFFIPYFVFKTESGYYQYMKKILYIKGMTCNSCKEKIEGVLKDTSNIDSFEISFDSRSVTLDSKEDVSIETLNHALAQKGDFMLTDKKPSSALQVLKKFAPLITMFALVTAYTIYGQVSFGSFYLHHAMADFMGAFFLLFGLLKVINLHKFAVSYGKYDLIAQKVPAWGYVYPLFELAFAYAYFTQTHLLLVNFFVFVLMSLKAYSVNKKLSKGESIQCACLGAFFNIPITKVTVIEDVVMALMACVMLFIK
jgi:copper chaperone CopZ